MPHLIQGAGAIPQYRLENDLKLPAQIEFRKIMLAEVKKSGRRMFDQIAERVHAKRHLSFTSVTALVPEEDRLDVEKRALSSFVDGDWPPEPKVKLGAEELLPSCFGVAETVNIKAFPCSNCPLVEKCLALGHQAMNVTERLTGSASPVWEADKARNRRNTSNSRSRKAEDITLTEESVMK